MTGFLKTDSDKSRSRIPTFDSLGFRHVGQRQLYLYLAVDSDIHAIVILSCPYSEFDNSGNADSSQPHLPFRHSDSSPSSKCAFLFRLESFLALGHSDSCSSDNRLSPIRTATICHSDKSEKNCRRKSRAVLKTIRTNTGITPGNRPAGSPGFRCSARRRRHTSACGYRGGRLIFGNASPVRDSGLFSAAAFSSLSSA